MTRNKMLLALMMVLLIGSFSNFCQGAQAKDEVLKIVAGQEPLSMDHSQYTSGNDSLSKTGESSCSAERQVERLSQVWLRGRFPLMERK
jgi:hypothetical protein